MSETCVAYVVKMFPRLSETFVVNEILELERRGLPLVIYSLKRPLPGPRHAMLGRIRSPIVYLPDRSFSGLLAIVRAHARLFARSPGPWSRTLVYILSRHSWAAIKRFFQAAPLTLDAAERNVVHLHAHFASSATRVAMLSSRLSPVTYSFTAHAKDIYLDGQDVDLLRDKLVEARFTVTVSDFNRAHLERLCGPKAVERVVRIYNGVDLGGFDGAAPARARGRIVCVARLVEKKGVGDLLEACAQLRARGTSFTCRIVGDGPLRASLEAQARRLGIADRVTFVGALPHEQVVRELASAQVLALPCVVAADGNRDGLPTVILEAMASRTAVISTRVTAIPEMVLHDETGLIVEPGDPHGLAAALASLLEDPDRCRRMGERGRERVEERFMLERNVGELHRRLRDVTIERRRPRMEHAKGSANHASLPIRTPVPFRGDAERPPTLRRLLVHFGPHVRRERAGLLVAAAASVVLAATEVLQPWPIKLVLDDVLHLHHGFRGGLLRPLAAWPTDQLLLLVTASLVAIAVTRGLAGFAQTFYLSRAGQRIVTGLRERTFDHLQGLSLGFHRRSRTGDLLVRLTGDINVLSDVLVQASVDTSGRVLQLAGMIAAMLWMDRWLTLAALAIFPPVALVVARYSGQLRTAARAQRKRESAIAARAGETIAHIAVVKAFTREDEESRRFAAESHAVLTAGVRAGRIESAMRRTVEVLVAVGTGMVVWLGVHRVLEGLLSPGDLIVFTAYLRQMYRPTREIANMANRMSKARASAERVADILEVQPEVVERRGAVVASRFKGSVRFEGVSYAYVRGTPVLEGIHFDVAAGTHVALVGPTGSGKSTLVGCIPRFHEPLTGRVCVDGHDLREFTLRSVRQQISLVLQDAMLFGATIRDNIAYGRLEATQEEIEAAARVAQIHDFVISLPEGYDTVVGERGATLSGGQKQRISVARAVLRDAPILILDEPTTGLDAESEAAVRAALERLMAGRTTFLITHRMAAVRHADLILVLDRGRLAGRGTHGELVESCPLYRRLVQHEESGHASVAV